MDYLFLKICYESHPNNQDECTLVHTLTFQFRLNYTTSSNCKNIEKSAKLIINVRCNYVRKNDIFIANGTSEALKKKNQKKD